MKKTLKKTLLALAALVTITAFSGCKKDGGKANCELAEQEIPAAYAMCSKAYFEIPPTNAANGKTFNYTKFMALLEDSLSGIGGYQICLTEGGFTKFAASKGFARGPKECPPMNLTTCHRMNAASVTKMFTAAATLKLLYAQGLDEDDSIGPFIPASWNAPVGVRNLTFKQMFSHRSGMHMNSTNSDFDNTLSYAGLRTFVQAGVNSDSIGLQRYRNANVALMRILIPQIWKGAPGCPADLLAAGEIDDNESQKYYEQAIKTLIFSPVGVDAELDGTNLDEYKALYYVLDSNATGHAEGNWKNKAGGGGWFINANDMCNVINGIFYGPIVSNNIATAMTSNFMGIWNTFNTPDGTFFGHGGDISTGSYEMHSMLVFNPSNGIAIAININSKPKTAGGLTSTVQQAYIGAWE